MGTRGVFGSQIHFDWSALSKIADSVFGNLEFDGANFWDGLTGFSWLGEPLRLSIEGTLERPPGDLERAVFQKFLELHTGIEKPVERAIFGYYNEVRPIYRDAMGDYADQLAPVLSTSSLIWPLLSYPSLCIPEQSETWSFEYHFESEWDVEHGLSVIVRDGPMFGVDMQVGPGWEHIVHYNAAGERIDG